MTEKQGNSLSGIGFVVDEKPYCLWGTRLESVNDDFVKHIDPTYFEYLAEVHFPNLDSPDCSHTAALALRNAYFHALETFFALLFAAIQAPTCVVGWMQKYQVKDLASLVGKIKARDTVLSTLDVSSPSWAYLARKVMECYVVADDSEKEREVKELMGRLWSRFADDFADYANNREYNSFKHGLQVKKGGVTMSIGPENTPGERATKMVRLIHGEFGCTFYDREKIGEQNLSFAVRQYMRNWSPEVMYKGLYLAAMSISNVLAYIQVSNGTDASTVSFTTFTELGAVQEWFNDSIRTRSGFGYRDIIDPERIPVISPNEILELYSSDVDASRH